MVKQPWNVHRSDLLTTSLQNFNQRTIAGTVTKNDIWRAAIISITTRSLEPLTDPGGTLNITRPHDANNSRMNLLYQRPWTNGGKCVQSNQTARKKKKKERLCLGPCHKQENFTITRSKLLSKQKRQSVRHGTTQRKGNTDDHWLFSQRKKLETNLHVFPNFSESATLSWWCNVLRMSTHCEHKTNNFWPTQSRLMKHNNHGKYDFGTKRPASVSGAECVPQDHTVQM